MMLKETKPCSPAVALGAKARRGSAQARQAWGQLLQTLLKALAVWAV
jgi:hypothetical protein